MELFDFYLTVTVLKTEASHDSSIRNPSQPLLEKVFLIESDKKVDDDALFDGADRI